MSNPATPRLTSQSWSRFVIRATQSARPSRGRFREILYLCMMLALSAVGCSYEFLLKGSPPIVNLGVEALVVEPPAVVEFEPVREEIYTELVRSQIFTIVAPSRARYLLRLRIEGFKTTPSDYREERSKLPTTGGSPSTEQVLKFHRSQRYPTAEQVQLRVRAQLFDRRPTVNRQVGTPIWEASYSEDKSLVVLDAATPPETLGLRRNEARRFALAQQGESIGRQIRDSLAGLFSSRQEP